MATPLAWWRWLRQWRRTRLHVDRAEVLAHVADGGALRPRYGFMTVMSCGIATLGLLQDSVAVIIGAMLISPLMGPIVQLGMALAVFDLHALRRALTTLGVGVAAALAVSVAIVALSPLKDATPQILARTEPTLFDLLVAVFSGLAGAYATITRKGEAIVGVAIATALMPPLAVVGYGLALGNAEVAGGAFFLFMTNLLAIALSVMVMARWYGFALDDSPRQTWLQAVLIVATVGVLSLPLGVALRDIAARTGVEATVRATLEAAAAEGGGRITTLRVERVGTGWRTDAVLLTPRHRDGLSRALETRLRARIEAPVQVQLREVLTTDEARLQAEQATLAELRASVDRLQGDARRDAAQASARDARLARLQAAASATLGQWTLDGDEGVPVLRLQPSAGLDLARARRLEQALQAIEPAARVVPAVSRWPPVVFAADAVALDAADAARVADAGWALQRLGYTRVRLVAHGVPARRASERADAVAALLPAGLAATPVVPPRARQAARAAFEGEAAWRTVWIEPLDAPP